jgi:hypothetical protein
LARTSDQEPSNRTFEVGKSEGNFTHKNGSFRRWASANFKTESRDERRINSETTENRRQLHAEEAMRLLCIQVTNKAKNLGEIVICNGVETGRVFRVGPCSLEPHDKSHMAVKSFANFEATPGHLDVHHRLPSASTELPQKVASRGLSPT